MRRARGSIVIVLIAFVLLLVQSVFSKVLAPHPFSPYLALPLVFALGIAPGVPLVRGAATSFALGYLYDVFTGNFLGPHTLVFVLGYLAAWAAGRMLSYRGVLFEMSLTFGLTVLVGGLVEIIRGFVFTPWGIAADGVTVTISLFASAFATALISPLLFALLRWIDPESERVPT